MEMQEFKDTQIKFFENFISKSLDYQDKLRTQYESAVESGGHIIRLHVNIPDLETAQEGLSWEVLKAPGKYLGAFESGAMNWASSGEPGFEKFSKNLLPIRIALTGAAGRHHITPRGLNADMVCKLVTVEGIVTRATISKPRPLLSVHHCTTSSETRTREHPDPCSLSFQEIGGGDVPQKDEDGNRFDTELGLCYYKDIQSFNIQEMPESAPPGEIPRSVEVRCDDDLVDIAHPGARVRVTGMYKTFPKVDERGITDGCFPCKIIANNIQIISEDINRTIVTAQDIRACKMISKRDDTIDLLTRSFAPSICGHEIVKKGMLLLMAGGAEKNLANGTHLRGDINVLLVGDPSCGKSQMLRFVMNIAKMSVSTTGRGSSGVGLTAAVRVDKKTGERSLDAGAMVLADRGIVCIDEFDKMGVNDRVAIHEVMEQQTVTIAKAGIHTTLNARCSVLAAANPLYSSFEDSIGLAKNINLPDSLLSRFDLIYIVRDLLTVDQDRKIASQVLRQARYCKTDGAGEQNEQDEFHETIYERKEDENFEVAKKISEKIFEQKKFTSDEILTVGFLKKYLTVCAKRDPPTLSQAACLKIGAAYGDLRQRVKNSANRENELSVTTRTLESMIRLSTAIAKLKMRDEVLEEDVAMTRDLIFATRGYTVSSGEDGNRPIQHGGILDMDDGETMETGSSSKQLTQASAPLLELNNARLLTFQLRVGKSFAMDGVYAMETETLFERINAFQVKEKDTLFTKEEFELGRKHLCEKNKLIEDKGTIYLTA